MTGYRALGTFGVRPICRHPDIGLDLGDPPTVMYV